jgi:hypothetical protein
MKESLYYFKISLLIGGIIWIIGSCASNKPGLTIKCPNGSVNTGMDITIADCDTVVKYDGNVFEGKIFVSDLVDAGFENGQQVLRDVKDAATAVQIQYAQYCKAYNACNLKSAEFAAKVFKLQDSYQKLVERVSLLEAVKENYAIFSRNFNRLYNDVVPRDKINKKAIALELIVQAKRKGGQVAVVKDGVSLRTGEEIVLGLKLSKSAYVYLFQRKPSGTIKVLFPNDTFNKPENPISPSYLVRIPPFGYSYVLNDKDIGEEIIYVVVSKNELENLSASLSNIEKDSKAAQRDVERTMVNLFNEHRPECAGKQQELQRTTGIRNSACDQILRGVQSQKTENDKFFSNYASAQLQTAPGDDLLIQTFRFQHSE